MLLAKHQPTHLASNIHVDQVGKFELAPYPELAHCL